MRSMSADRFTTNGPLGPIELSILIPVSPITTVIFAWHSAPRRRYALRKPEHQAPESLPTPTIDVVRPFASHCSRYRRERSV